MRPIPWQLRFAFDLSLFFVPAYFIVQYPRLVTHFVNDKRRIQRRRDYNEQVFREDSTLSQEQVLNLRQSLGFKDLH
ncbi:hypothetical protein pb186bvf_017460 [Paramecium bursaria]